MATNSCIVDGEGTYVFTLGDKMLKKAQSELSEKEKWRARDIEALREKVKAHKGLYCPTDDKFLLKFLRARKFDYDRAYDMLCNYYTIRAQNKDIFSTLAPSVVKHVLDAGVSFVLPEKDKEGRRIVSINPGRWDCSFPVFDILKTNVINMETLLMEDEEIQINGVVLIIDASGVGVNHIKHFDRLYGKLMSSIMQDSFPLRFKGMHLMNGMAILGTVFALIKPFLKDKTLKRFHFHGGNLTELYKHFDKSCLPEELGGTLPCKDILAKEWKEKVFSREAEFQDMLQYKIQVDHRITNVKTSEIMDCMVGSYKKLNVD